MPDDLRGADIIVEIKCTINAMHLNHLDYPSPTSSLSMEVLSSMKLVPGAKNMGDPYFIGKKPSKFRIQLDQVLPCLPQLLLLVLEENRPLALEAPLRGFVSVAL